MSNEAYLASQPTEHQPTERPPIGCTPRNIHDAIRITELLHAMRRYVEVGKKIPEHWIVELSDRNRSLRP